jgi:hypothetical protein
MVPTSRQYRQDFKINTSSDGLSNIYDKHVTVYLPKASRYSALINGLVDKIYTLT